MLVDFPKIGNYSEAKKGFLYQANKSLSENPIEFVICAHKNTLCNDLLSFCKKKFKELRANKI
jgi:hypothetical protein